jgi:hypothetical protein
VLLGVGVAVAVTVSAAVPDVPEPDDGLGCVVTASVAPLDPLPVEPSLPELVLDTAASVALDPDEVGVLGAGSDAVVVLGAGSDAVEVLGAGSDVGDGDVAGVGSGEGAGALGAGSVVALLGAVVVVAGAVVSVTGAVALCVVVATVSVAVATGSEVVAVFVVDPASAAVPLTSLMTSPSRLGPALIPLLLSGYPSRVDVSTRGKTRSFFGVT